MGAFFLKKKATFGALKGLNEGNKQITSEMGVGTGPILVGDAHICPGWKPKWKALYQNIGFGHFGAKLGILAHLSPIFDHFMAFFGDFCEFFHWTVYVF